MTKLDRDWLQVASGVVDDDAIDILRSFLNGRPLPTKAVRDAILHILLCEWDTLGIGRKLIALLFDPEISRPRGLENPQWTLAFKKIGKTNVWQEDSLAMAVQARRDCGKSYETAIEETADDAGFSERHVARIYAKYKGRFPTSWREVLRTKIPRILQAPKTLAIQT
jgi:AraC-like DNA-binding protein